MESEGRKEEILLFNDALNTFYFTVKDHPEKNWKSDQIIRANSREVRLVTLSCYHYLGK